MEPGALDSIRALSGLGSRRDPEARQQVAREFEALLVGEMMKSASKPLLAEGALSGGKAGRMWQELFLEQLVRQAAGNFGIAKETLRLLEAQDESPEETP